jgi:transcriptional regulator of acetoin/glycerol metabolism
MRKECPVTSSESAIVISSPSALVHATQILALIDITLHCGEKRELLIERTNSGLAASRARGRKGGRKREFSPAAARKAQERYDKAELSVTEIARLAGVSRQTLYRYLNVTKDRESAPAG